MDQRKLMREYWKGQIYVWFKHNGAAFGLISVLVLGLGGILWLRNSDGREALAGAAIVVTVPNGYAGPLEIVVDETAGAKVPEKGRINLKAVAGVVRVATFKRFVRLSREGATQAPTESRERVSFIDDQGRVIPYGGGTTTRYAVWFLDSDRKSYEAFYVGATEGMEAERRRIRTR